MKGFHIGGESNFLQNKIRKKKASLTNRDKNNLKQMYPESYGSDLSKKALKRSLKMRRYYSRLRRQSSSIEPVINNILEDLALTVDDYISDGEDFFADKALMKEEITDNVDNYKDDILNVIDKIVTEKLKQRYQK